MCLYFVESFTSIFLVELETTKDARWRIEFIACTWVYSLWSQLWLLIKTLVVAEVIKETNPTGFCENKRAKNHMDFEVKMNGLEVYIWEFIRLYKLQDILRQSVLGIMLLWSLRSLYTPQKAVQTTKHMLQAFELQKNTLLVEGNLYYITKAVI